MVIKPLIKGIKEEEEEVSRRKGIILETLKMNDAFQDHIE